MKKSIIIIACLMTSCFFACKKVIDIKETDFIGGSVALKTVANNQQVIIGAYAVLNNEDAYILNSMLSDEVKVGEFYNSQTIHEWQYGSADVGLLGFTIMTNFYRTVDRANRVLEALPNVVAANATEESLKSRLKGEALFLRAFAHFCMYQYYSNSSVGTDLALPYLDKPSLEPKARATVAVYFQKLKADLSEAKPLLPDNFTDIYRATKLAAAGLQARMALYLKEYNDAIIFSTEYINGLPLASRASFSGIWSDANNAEQAFKLNRTNSYTQRTGSYYRGTSANASNIGTVVWRPSDKLWNSYDQVNDIRFSAYVKAEPLLIAANRGGNIVTKYAGTAYGTATENVSDIKLFRTGEMYLIRAEAKAETNDLVGAASDLNALRAARINGYVNVSLATKDIAITEIMNERFKELAFEGHRFFDLKRRGLPVTRLLSDAQNTTSQTLTAGDYHFLLPIPITEIQVNKLMQQNPGYAN